jgi:hypothetical protein
MRSRACSAGLTYTIVENQNYNGASQQRLLLRGGRRRHRRARAHAPEHGGQRDRPVRPLTSTFGVFAPVVVNAAVVMTCTVAAGYDPVATKSLVGTA